MENHGGVKYRKKITELYNSEILSINGSCSMNADSAVREDLEKDDRK